MTSLRVLDLFSGIGGFSLGLERTGGFRTVAFCGIAEFQRRILSKHWPEAPIYHDVRTLNADILKHDGIAVDVICAGFPRQDVSIAGRGEGIDGSRTGLWREVIRLAEELAPRLVILENISQIRSRGLERLLSALDAIGYDGQNTRHRQRRRAVHPSDDRQCNPSRDRLSGNNEPGQPWKTWNMIIEHHHNEYCDEDVVYIWIDEAQPPGFELRLLMELLALAGPRRFGSRDASGRRDESAYALIEEELQRAAYKHGGEISSDKGYRFDYVDGYRIKVEYLPFGRTILEDSCHIRRRNPGMPRVSSADLEGMYGDGALAGVIERALAVQ